MIFPELKIFVDYECNFGFVIHFNFYYLKDFHFTVYTVGFIYVAMIVCHVKYLQTQFVYILTQNSRIET